MPPGMKIDLQDKVAIITGASRGIGADIAQAFVDAGAKVVLASRKQASLEPVAAALEARGGEALAVACHTGDPAQVEALVAAAVARFGKVDVLVNNAATNPYFGPMLGVEWPAWDKTFDVNVKGYFAAARAVAQHLMARGAPGAILNVSSILGLRAGRFQGVYAMTKAAVISMTKTLAVEWGPSGIRVNAIAPGFIETRFSAALTSNDAIKKMILDKTPLGRIGAPEDLTGLAVYLASDAAGFVTGATFVADGGLTVE
jgi:NAD(P)-dependent dehydrogenase (short-subunit alcohol dehydrogenase family)